MDQQPTQPYEQSSKPINNDNSIVSKFVPYVLVVIGLIFLWFTPSFKSSQLINEEIQKYGESTFKIGSFIGKLLYPTVLVIVVFLFNKLRHKSINKLTFGIVFLIGSVVVTLLYFIYKMTGVI